MKTLNELIADVVENGRVEIIDDKFDAESLEVEVSFAAEEEGYDADEAERFGALAALIYVMANKAA